MDPMSNKLLKFVTNLYKIVLSANFVKSFWQIYYYRKDHILEFRIPYSFLGPKVKIGFTESFKVFVSELYSSV